MQATGCTETSQPVPGSWRDYLELAKPIMVSIQVVLALTAMFVSGETIPSISVIVVTVLGGVLAAGGASALNNYIDMDLDSLVKRTKNRPLPAQRLMPEQARVFGIGLIAISFMVLLMGTNLLAAVLSMVGVFLYVGVYSYWLKRRTPYSTLAGAAAYAMSPLVGWAAATGTLSIHALILPAIVFYWTAPHYWSLALVELREYVRAGLPMLPVVQGSQPARIQIGRHAVMMITMSLLPVGLGMAHMFYALFAITLGSIFIYLAAQLMLRPSSKIAWSLHKYSLLYLAVLLVGLMADRVLYY